MLLVIFVIIFIVVYLKKQQTEHMVSSQCKQMMQRCCDTSPDINQYPQCDMDLFRSVCPQIMCNP